MAGKDIWFWFHLFCQLAGLAVFIAGFTIALKEFDSSDKHDTLSTTHKIMGITIFSAACFQVKSRARGRVTFHFGISPTTDCFPHKLLAVLG